MFLNINKLKKESHMIVTIPGASLGKEFAYNANGDLSGDSSSIPGSR